MEDIIGSLEYVSGHTYDTVYQLFFTTERVIAFLVQSPSDVPPKWGILDMVFLGNWRTKNAERFEKKRIADERTRDIKDKSPDELLHSHRLNQEIRYDDIESVEIKHGLFGYSLHFCGAEKPDSTFKLSFSLDREMVKEAKKLIEKTLSGKYKY